MNNMHWDTGRYLCDECLEEELCVIDEDGLHNRLYYCWKCDKIFILTGGPIRYISPIAPHFQGMYKTSCAANIRKVHEERAFTSLW